jgi:arsenate reductase-like glutaredoxin family protein
VDRAGALALARAARRLLIKAGKETVRFDAARRPVSEAEALRYLVHDDGLMRIPVLVWGDLLVRGYTEELYREALDVKPATEGEAR